MEVGGSGSCQHTQTKGVVLTGGRLRFFKHVWCSLTNNQFILNSISGYKIEFKPGVEPPVQHMPQRVFLPSAVEKVEGQAELDRLVAKGIIEMTTHEPQEFVSNIFLKTKKDGGCRIIIDLTSLNQSVEYQHFKMETFVTARQLISKGYYMASIDIKDAYYLVPIHKDYFKYLKFIWRGQLWQYRALPNGLTTAPRLFTKILKVAMKKLRELKHLVVAYLDDVLILGRTRDQAVAGVLATKQLLETLGFILHPDKSILEPTTNMDYLGFTIDTIHMTVTLPRNKTVSLIEACSHLIATPQPRIRHVARVIGSIVAAFPAAQHGPLHYQNLQRARTHALRLHRGHYDRKMDLPAEAKLELQWWVDNIWHSHSPITVTNPNITIATDASALGWGATNSKDSTGGRWTNSEASLLHSLGINFLEMLAAFYGLKAYASGMRHVHVRIMIDNTTAVSYIQHMGGIKSVSCDKLTAIIWQWCVERHIWLSAAYLPGKLNLVADTRSRKFNDNIEWMLDPKSFAKIIKQYGTPDIDLFASRLNHQLPMYVAWEPDPEAAAVDAFTLDWGNFFFYAFPPFCLISRVLQKIQADSASGILVVPDWPTQPWFPMFHDMVVETPMVLQHHPQLLTHPVTGISHPCHQKLKLLVSRF